MADDGINGAFVTIPTVSMRRADGLAINAELGTGVTARLVVDPRLSVRVLIQRAGAHIPAETAGHRVVGLSLRLHREAQPPHGAGDQSRPPRNLCSTRTT